MAHRPKPAIRGHGSRFARKKWEAEHKKGGIGYQSEKDKADAKKEADLTKILKNKPKGGYSKENTKDPGPGVGKDGKQRKATLEEDRNRNKPKPTPKTNSKKNNLKVKGIGPVAPDHKNAKAYAKHLNERAEKRKVTGEGPVTDRKKYGETLKKRAAEKEAEEFKKWKKKTRNSPARLSGAWTDKELWEKAKKGRKWAADRKSGKLKKERKKNLKITTWRDLE